MQDLRSWPEPLDKIDQIGADEASLTQTSKDG